MMMMMMMMMMIAYHREESDGSGQCGRSLIYDCLLAIAIRPISCCCDLSIKAYERCLRCQFYHLHRAGLDLVSFLSDDVEHCVSSWMCSNRLQLNADKAEVMWRTSTRKLTQRPSSPLPVAGALVQPVDAVRDL